MAKQEPETQPEEPRGIADESEKTESITKETDTKPREETVLMNVPIPGVPDSVKAAFERLRDDIISLHEQPNYITLVMAVNTGTAKADLIPIPTKANMQKLMSNLDMLPEAVRDAIKKNIPAEDMKASEEIWHFFKSFDGIGMDKPKGIAEKVPDKDKK